MQNRKRNTVWIVDDCQLNIDILTRILQRDYRIKAATGGLDALEQMKKTPTEIAAIIVDLHMPGFSGFDFLKACKERASLKEVPVLISSAEDQLRIEKRCLESGASDFIPMPYEPSVVRYRLRNVIERTWFRVNENDPLTGVSSKEKYIADTERYQIEYQEKKISIVSLDIDNFKAYNYFFGVEEGDRLLQYVAQVMVEFLDQGDKYCFGRYGADCFLITCEYSEERITQMLSNLLERFNVYNASYRIKPAIGVYIIEDPDWPIEMMINAARMAGNQCKGKFHQYIAYYDSLIGDEVIREQEILNEVEQALYREEFVIYYQPKYSLLSGQADGAEALVRWERQNRIIMPNEFIPILEKSMQIGQLDFYVLEHVCMDIQALIAQGIRPMPVSTNMSLVNLYNPNYAKQIQGILLRYNIPPELINLEFTESAFVENTDLIRGVMRQLHEIGLRIFLDDFGKGTASLTMLYQLPVDLLKIDMMLLPDHPEQDRGGKILSSIMQMANMLKLPVVCEGVENEQQVKFLRKMQCDYAQGFFFAKPMSKERYEAGLKDGFPVMALEKYDDCINAEMQWNSLGWVESFFNSVDTPMMVFAMQDDIFHVVRINQKMQKFYGRDFTEEDIENFYNSDRLSKETRARFEAEAKAAIHSKTALQIDFSVTMPKRIFRKEDNLWIRMNYRYVEYRGGVAFYSATLKDMTAEGNHGSIKNEKTYSEDFAKTALKMSNVNAWYYDPHTHEISFEVELTRDYGWGEVLPNVPDSIIESEIVHPEDEEPFREFYRRLDAGEPFIESVFRIKPELNANSYELCRMAYTNIYDRNNHPVRAIGVSMHVANEEKNVLTAYREGHFQRMISPDVYFMAIMNLTTMSLELVQTGIEELEGDFHDKPHMEVFEDALDFFVRDLHVRAELRSLWAERRLEKNFEEGKTYLEYEFRKDWKDTGKRQWMVWQIFLQKRPVTGEILAYVYIRDNDKDIRERQGLQKAARIDSMTGLLNHNAAVEEVENYLLQAGENGFCALFMIDIDYFKQINDEHGHLIGDEAIIMLAKKLRKNFRQSDVVGRYGGDEFIVFMRNAESLEQVREKMIGLKKALNMHLEAEQASFDFTCSIGYAVRAKQEADCHEMIEAADAALYEAKRNRIQGTL
ncbi:MAG: EAL domain-containing protein [Lachnospiraceae bacterium]|nr:EAL domain-containing protein [Lachnospiraceae bacterium]